MKIYNPQKLTLRLAGVAFVVLAVLLGMEAGTAKTGANDFIGYVFGCVTMAWFAWFCFSFDTRWRRFDTRWRR